MGAAYAFFCGKDETTLLRIRAAALNHWGVIKEIGVDGFRLFISAAHYEQAFA